MIICFNVIIQSNKNIYILDCDRLRARVGQDRFDDLRGWYLAKAPISSVGLAELAKEYAAFIRPLTAKTKKCLVLDLDNTLWGGVLGEEGLAGIKLVMVPGTQLHRTVMYPLQL